MNDAIRFFQQYESVIYFFLAIGVVVYSVRFYSAWQELRGSVFGLEQVGAQRRLTRSALAIFVILLIGVGVFSLITFAPPFLDRYLSLGRKEYTQSDSEGAIFISQMGGRISRQGVWQLIKEWGEKAGLDVSVTPRILRNTKVREMVQAGLSTAEIQRKLGHSNRYSTRALLRKINRKAF